MRHLILLTFGHLVFAALNINPTLTRKNFTSISPGRSSSGGVTELAESPSGNNSIWPILKSRPGKLTPSEEKADAVAEIFPIANQGPECGNETATACKSDPEEASTPTDNDEFDYYFVRNKRAEQVGNFTDYNETAFNDTLSEEQLRQNLMEFITPRSWTWVLIFFHMVVFVVGIIGNILVCVAVYRNHTMRTVTNYFIVNLAVADFLVILFCLPPSVVWDVTITWFFGVAMCKIVLYVQSVSVTVSVLTLTFISIDRWYAICFPLKFKSTTGRAQTAIGIIWIVALACDLPEVIYVTTVARVQEFETILLTQCEPAWSDKTDTIFAIIRIVLFYFIPLMFMSIAYLQIIKVLWKSGNVPHQIIGKDVGGNRQVNTFAMNMNASTEGQLRSRRKAAKMLVAVVVMFAFCYFPVHLLSILRLTVDLKNTDGNRAFSLISHWLCYANSAVNPIIYNFMSGKFRKEFRASFNKCSTTEASDANFRNSTYTYRFTVNQQSCRSRTEIIPLNSMHNKAVQAMD